MLYCITSSRLQPIAVQYSAINHNISDNSLIACCLSNACPWYTFWYKLCSSPISPTRPCHACFSCPDFVKSLFIVREASFWYSFPVNSIVLLSHYAFVINAPNTSIEHIANITITICLCPFYFLKNICKFVIVCRFIIDLSDVYLLFNDLLFYVYLFMWYVRYVCLYIIYNRAF